MARTSSLFGDHRGGVSQGGAFHWSTPVTDLTNAIYSIGDSYNALTGSAYGTSLAQRVDGRFALFSKSGDAYPGQSAATIRTALQGMTNTKKLSVMIIEAGRNGVLTDTSGTRAAILGMVSDIAAIGNTRYVVTEVPYKPSEVTSGAGTTNYDLVTAHNAWLAATFPGRVVSCSDIANTYPSGDDTHVTAAGYDVWCMRISDKLASLGFLTTSLPSNRAQRSINLDTIGKYEWVVVPDATNDRMPRSTSVESSMFVWIKAKDASSGGWIIGRNSNATSTARLGVRYSSGSLFGFCGNGVFTSVVTGVPIDLGWHLVGITVRDISGTKKMDLWLDGVVRGTQQTVGALSAVWPFVIGESSDLPGAGGSGTSFAFLGKYYQPMVWNVGLSAAQCLALYNGGIPLSAAASPAASNMCHYPDIENISLYANTRGLPDRTGTNDSRTTGFTSADISTDIP